MSIGKLCTLFGVLRLKVSYKPTEAMVEEKPSFVYRTVPWLPGFRATTAMTRTPSVRMVQPNDRTTMRPLFQLKDWS
ncbi:hypothetical protein [Pseudooceanicola spongiae]|uniref:Uncharacterized protein n=1 Tax=Pseudooceanicola spongiae TaxID=2613965 RepID=A0A7L9WH20_9RHOB|nr:hypothetical protein [Pseudooceanicola spongiae]QOL79661.1 hypothetical protein F3W81_01760 [Pseudooceanicola spongiae]